MSDLLYDRDHIAFLEEMWGAGYLSPGGPAEVTRLLAGTDLAGCSVLDIGCGAGGITRSLVEVHGAGHVTGLDVEPEVCAASRAVCASLPEITIVETTPGPLPFGADCFDVVFSKDSIVHISDKAFLAAEAYRVLKPGGVFVASDWMIGHDDEPSRDMVYYLKCEDLDFGMASPSAYRRALEEAGFVAVTLSDRSGWYAGEARSELARLRGPDRPRFEAIMGAEEIARQITTWTAMIPVLDTGEHCPHHFRAVKPGS